MNDKAMEIISQKLLSARNREGLSNKEVSDILGLKTHHYVVKICSSNPDARKLAPAEAWRLAQAWTNSGLALRKFGAKKAEINEAAGVIINATTELNAKTGLADPIDGSNLDDLPGDVQTVIGEGESENEPEKHLTESVKESVTEAVGAWAKVSSSGNGAAKNIDRLKTILDFINELKELGYKVDISIYPESKN